MSLMDEWWHKQYGYAVQYNPIAEQQAAYQSQDSLVAHHVLQYTVKSKATLVAWHVSG
jgi:hypothetical protein